MSERCWLLNRSLQKKTLTRNTHKPIASRYHLSPFQKAAAADAAAAAAAAKGGDDAPLVVDAHGSDAGSSNVMVVFHPPDNPDDEEQRRADLSAYNILDTVRVVLCVLFLLCARFGDSPARWRYRLMSLFIAAYAAIELNTARVGLCWVFLGRARKSTA